MSLPENILHCPNCGHQPFNTDFCPKCGQKKLTEKDMKVTSIVGDFISGFLSLENSFINTFKAFTTNPAKYVQEYNEGARKKFIAPVKWFLLANAFYFLFPAINTFTTTLDIQLNKLYYSKLTDGLILSAIEHSGQAFVEFESEYNALTFTLSKALLFILPLLFGIGSRLTNIKHQKPTVFHINHSFILYAFVVLFTTSLLPGAYIMIAKILHSDGMMNLITETNLTLVSLLLINTYGLFLYRTFFKSPWWGNVFRWITLNLFFIVLLYFYRFFLLISTLSWMWLFS